MTTSEQATGEQGQGDESKITVDYPQFETVDGWHFVENQKTRYLGKIVKEGTDAAPVVTGNLVADASWVLMDPCFELAPVGANTLLVPMEAPPEAMLAAVAAGGKKGGGGMPMAMGFQQHYTSAFGMWGFCTFPVAPPTRVQRCGDVSVSDLPKLLQDSLLVDINEKLKRLAHGRAQNEIAALQAKEQLERQTKIAAEEEAMKKNGGGGSKVRLA